MISIASGELRIVFTAVLTNKGIIASAVEVFSNHPVFTGFGLLLEAGLHTRSYSIRRRYATTSDSYFISFENPNEVLISPQSIAITRLATGLVACMFTALCYHRRPPLEDGCFLHTKYNTIFSMSS